MSSDWWNTPVASKGIDPLEASPIDLPDARLPAAASVKPLGVTAC
jgi:hypothetical protein